MIARLFRRNPLKEQADALYRRVAAAARDPDLFARHGVPDTVEGRFEALSLHVFMVTSRLDSLGAPGAALAQEFVDRFFLDLDGAVRALGIGDLSVGKKVKAYARNFYGRVDAYREALAADAGPNALEAALRRNLLGVPKDSTAPVDALAAYVRASRGRLWALDLIAISSGKPLFASEVLT